MPETVAGLVVIAVLLALIWLLRPWRKEKEPMRLPLAVRFLGGSSVPCLHCSHPIKRDDDHLFTAHDVLCIRCANDPHPPVEIYLGRHVA